jgi:cation diffusion facilitator CzcD-associated flavoprotein CzcO
MIQLSQSAALAALDLRVKEELETLEVPLRAWVPEHRDANGAPLTDVVVVGAGLSGLAIAFGLKRQGVARVTVIDAAEKGREGPWVTSARMRTLRSPKTLTGPDLGVPSLTYRAWHEAVHGIESWRTLDKIDRVDWMDYLCWFRQAAGIEVTNGTRLVRIEPQPGYLSLVLATPQGETRLGSRKVVLATGIEGAGGHNIPAGIELPRERWNHSGECFDAAALKGKSVGVVGAAASSFDLAVAALEAGAASVTILARSAEMPRTEILDWSNYPGFLNHFADLDDARRYRFTRRMFEFRTPPTMEMYSRALSFANCRLVLGAGSVKARLQGDTVLLSTAAGKFAVDHLLLGTGYAVDLTRRPELKGIVDSIATWADRFSPPEDEADADLLGYPYLGPAFEFTEKVPGTAAYLRDIHVFNNGAVPSLGPVCNGITGLKSGVPKLVLGIARGLFVADADWHFGSLDRYDKVHFSPPDLPL